MLTNLRATRNQQEANKKPTRSRQATTKNPTSRQQEPVKHQQTLARIGCGGTHTCKSRAGPRTDRETPDKSLAQPGASVQLPGGVRQRVGGNATGPTRTARTRTDSRHRRARTYHIWGRLLVEMRWPRGLGTHERCHECCCQADMLQSSRLAQSTASNPPAAAMSELLCPTTATTMKLSA